MYLNIRGMKSKIRSLTNVIEELQPTMICITESKLEKDETMEIEGYHLLRNDRNKDGGGIVIGVVERLKHITTIVEKKKDVEESLWVAVNNRTRTKLRVGVIYAPQECRTTAEEYIKMYE